MWLRGVRGFVKRHQRAIVLGAISGIVVAGAVRAKRALDDAMSILNDAERRMVALHRRQNHVSLTK